MDDKVTVIIAAHKKYQMPSDSMYLPVHVGATGKDSIEDNGRVYQRDDEGDNISDLNPYFCELTGLYWSWKNLKSDYIGLAHYRRHFSVHPRAKDKWCAVLKQSEIEDDIKNGVKVFTPNKRRYWIETLYSHYAHTHYASQLDEARKIIEEKYPEYIGSFDRAVKQRWGYMFNMMIMERKEFNDYCSWLFDILFVLRTRIGKEAEENLDKFQGRFYGRISEIIFNVWLLEQQRTGKIKNAEIKEIPLIHMEKINWWKKGGAFLKAKFAGKRYEGSF
ncbi:MAG: DUF4422 domain-containing protein [Oscillospiraceae bacterium]|nr:DUF4422 domain-containing protein [Oscillospiraceae bacterium]